MHHHQAPRLPRRTPSQSVCVALLTILLAVCVAVVAARHAQAASLTSDFQSYPTGTWAEGGTYGKWYVEYNGYGSVGIAKPSSLYTNKVHYQKPMTSTTPGETHASMVVSTQTFNGVDLTMRVKTVKQLRQGSLPNNWEVAWVVWGHSDDDHFYYFIPKPDGIEMGKVHPDYPGMQRYLVTASSPDTPVGTWNKVRVRQVGGTIDVWLNGTQVIKGFRDTGGPARDAAYLSGRVGMYNEDAHVYFDDVSAVSTS